MTRFALLPPEIQALERKRDALSRRLFYLSPNSRRGRALRREQLTLTARIVALELQHLDPKNCVTPASQVLDQTGPFKRVYWWDEL